MCIPRARSEQENEREREEEKEREREERLIGGWKEPRARDIYSLCRGSVVVDSSGGGVGWKKLDET